MSHAPTLIESDLDFEAFLRRAAELPVLGFDTEFVRTDTYHARPGLLQFNAEGEIALVDPLRISDFSALADMMTCLLYTSPSPRDCQ